MAEADNGAKGDGLGAWVSLWDEAVAFALMVAAFLAIRLQVLPELLRLASNKTYFASEPLLLDVRRGGYSAETVFEQLRALGPAARAYYATTFIPLYDVALALLVLLFSLLFILHATQPGKPYALQLSAVTRKLLLLPPILQLVFDVGENLSILALRETFPRVSQDVVKTASLFTQLKWLAMLASGVIVVALVVYTVYAYLVQSRGQSAASRLS